MILISQLRVAWSTVEESVSLAFKSIVKPVANHQYTSWFYLGSEFSPQFYDVHVVIRVRPADKPITDN